MKKSQKIPLTFGIELGNAAAVDLLARHGANINALDGKGLTPVQIAIEHRQRGILEQLLQAGADANAGKKSKSALAEAIQWDRAAVELLMNHKAVINYEGDQNYTTTLLLASLKGRSDIAGYLLEQGAEPYGVNTSGEQPLSLAIACSHENTVELLLKWCNQDTERLVAWMKNEPIYETLLHKAVVFPSTKIVELLLEYKADPTYKDKAGRTPLFLGLEMDSEEVLEPLIRTKQGINIHGGENFVSPLHVAAERGNVRLVTLLLQNGASESATDCIDRAPRMLAEERGHVEVANLLTEAESKAR